MKKKIVAVVYGIMIAALIVAFFQNRDGHVARKITNPDGSYSGSLTLGTASSTGTFYLCGRSDRKCSFQSGTDQCECAGNIRI